MTDTIRLATQNDAEDLLALTTAAYEPIRKLGLKFPAASADIESVHRLLSQGGTYALVRRGEIIATASIAEPGDVRKAIPYPCDLPFVWWVATRPSHSGSGVASSLLTWMEDSLVRDQLRAPAIALATSASHPWLVPFYERRGYRIFHRSGEGKNRVLMQKVLQ